MRSFILGVCLLFSEQSKVEAMLHVNSPKILREKFSIKFSDTFPEIEGGLKESFANFGLIPYGH